MRTLNCALGILLILASLCGCGKPAKDGPEPKGAKVTQPAPQTVAKVHWIGSKALAAQTNASQLKKILELPETAKLAAQTLDKLAIGLSGGWPVGTTNLIAWVTNYPVLLSTNHAAQALRPLLQDVLEQESYLEIRQITNQPGEFALAVRLDPARAGLWATNLAKAVGALTGTQPQVGSNALNWSCTLSNSPSIGTKAPQRLELSRAGNWTLVGLAPGQNGLLKELAGRIQPGELGTPAPAQDTNYWLESTFDLAGVSSALGLKLDLPPGLPKIWLGALGGGEQVLTKGRLTFSSPLPSELPAWNIPTNLINDPLHSFTAVRGFGPWLSEQPFWKRLQAGDAPNQLFMWTQSGSPFLDYFAAPMSNASNALDNISEQLMQTVNPILASNRMGVLQHSTNFHGVAWNRVPIIMPFLREQAVDGKDYVFGGLSPLAVTNTPPPQGTLSDLTSRTNVVYYASEITGPRIEAGMYLSQLFRIVMRRFQLPGEAGTIAWLKTAGPLIAPSLTVVARTGNNELSMERTSSAGLTATEMHLATEWLESPLIPWGLYSTLLKLPPPPPRRAGTNAPASAHLKGQ